MELYKYLPLVLLILLISVVAYSFFVLPLPIAEKEKTYGGSRSQPRCCEGEKRACVNDLGCDGESICFNGAWTGCTVQKTCNPGERALCIENFCSTSYKICNQCGTGYGECVK